MGRILHDATYGGLTRSQINDAINDWVFSARDRKILRLKLLDGLTYEQVAETLRPQMSPRQIKRIVCRYMENLRGKI